MELMIEETQQQEAPTQQPPQCGPAGWCRMMAGELEDEPYGRRRKKGLYAVTVFNLKTGASRLIGVTYRTGRKDDRRLMLNQCPWCGANLQWWEQAKHE